jgi:diacylglycerol kinase family enzyme
VLAIVPAGSGDGLARGLGLPAQARAALAAAAGGANVRAIDVGFLGDRHFVNIAGVGFDAVVAAGFNASGRRGALSYAAQALSSVWSYRCESYRVALDGLQSAGPHFVVAFGNGRQYGNGLVIAPDADPFDGRLNAVVVDGGGALAQLWRARRLFLRPLSPARGVRRAAIRAGSVEGASLSCHVDGEPFTASGTLAVRVAHGALRLAGVPWPG